MKIAKWIMTMICVSVGSIGISHAATVAEMLTDQKKQGPSAQSAADFQLAQEKAEQKVEAKNEVLNLNAKTRPSADYPGGYFLDYIGLDDHSYMIIGNEWARPRAITTALVVNTPTAPDGAFDQNFTETWVNYLFDKDTKNIKRSYSVTNFYHSSTNFYSGGSTLVTETNTTYHPNDPGYRSALKAMIRNVKVGIKHTTNVSARKKLVGILRTLKRLKH